MALSPFVRLGRSSEPCAVNSLHHPPHECKCVAGAVRVATGALTGEAYATYRVAAVVLNLYPEASGHRGISIREVLRPIGCLSKALPTAAYRTAGTRLAASQACPV